MIRNILSIVFLPILLIAYTGCEPPDHPELVDPEINNLIGMSIAFLVGEGFHDGETFVPMGYLTSRGARIVVIGAESGEVGSYNSDFTVDVHVSVDDVSPQDFDALVIPGGTSPGWLREHDNVVAFVKEYFEQQGLTAAICHGPQVLITAGVMAGRTATGVSGIKDEIEEAGATFHDEPVMRDNNLITSRIPDDLYHFSTAIEQALLEGVDRR